MTIKENNEQVNKRLDDIMSYFKNYQEEYREDRKIQHETNTVILEKVTENKTDIKNMRRLPIIISSLGSLLGITSLLIVIFGKIIGG